MPPPHNGASLAEKIDDLFQEWRINKNVFSLTLDNAFANDLCVEKLKPKLNMKKALLCKGEFFHMCCSTHIFNLIV